MLDFLDASDGSFATIYIPDVSDSGLKMSIVSTDL